MLTLQELKDMEPGIFRSGLVTDNSEGVNIAGTNQLLRWVAVRGGIHDWAIYVGVAEQSSEAIRDYGDKIHNRANVQKLVECDEEALNMYRD